MFSATLLLIAKKRKQPKSQSNDEKINKMWSTHAMEGYCHKKE